MNGESADANRSDREFGGMTAVFPVPSWMTPEERRAYWQQVAAFNVDALFRPRDESDMDVHTESLRGKVLALLDQMADIEKRLREELGDARYDELMALARGLATHKPRRRNFAAPTSL